MPAAERDLRAESCVSRDSEALLQAAASGYKRSDYARRFRIRADQGFEAVPLLFAVCFSIYCSACRGRWQVLLLLIVLKKTNVPAVGCLLVRINDFLSTRINGYHLLMIRTEWLINRLLLIVWWQGNNRRRNMAWGTF